jgi:preprotein translocase subunit SecF
MYQIIQKSKIWMSISGALVGLSIVALALWGLNFGIDFTGGSLLEIKFNENRPAVNEIQSSLEGLQLGSLIVQPIDEKGLVLRFQNTDGKLRQEVLAKLNSLVDKDSEKKPDENSSQEVNVNFTGSGTAEVIDTKDESQAIYGGLVELRYESVGPTIGNELKQKSVAAMFVVLLAIVAYISWAFRKVSKPVASWKYGTAATIALFHDVIITIGAFAVMGKFYDLEINSAFVAAILTVLGYSVNDTIVVFDRIRENLPKSDDNFEDTVNHSINTTITRSINTSFTVILALLAILIFGGESIRDFVLALLIGVFVGTYSSIFLASPLLVYWESRNK